MAQKKVQKASGDKPAEEKKEQSKEEAKPAEEAKASSIDEQKAATKVCFITIYSSFLFF